MKFDSIMVILMIIFFVWKSIREAKQKMEDQQDHQAAPPDFLRKVLKSDDPFEFILDEKPSPPTKKHAKDTKRRSTGMEKEKQGPRRSHQPVKEPPVRVPTTRLLPSKVKIDRKRLREAVIWSELLGPPLALRDEQRPGGPH